jgi:hypothetical protein
VEDQKHEFDVARVAPATVVDVPATNDTPVTTVNVDEASVRDGALGPQPSPDFDIFGFAC